MTVIHISKIYTVSISYIIHISKIYTVNRESDQNSNYNI